MTTRAAAQRAWTHLTSRTVMTFLGVGGVGYVVDVATFNLLLSVPPLAGHHPITAQILAVAVAMVVTYAGNRFWTWRGHTSEDIAREIPLFVVLNVIGMGFSVAALYVSHDLLHLTSRLADNLSANVVGVGLGTIFRYWSYQRYVFARPVMTGTGASGGDAGTPPSR